MPINENDRQRIIQGLAPLASMFPNWKPSRETIEVYVQILADLDPLMLEASIFHLLSIDLEFMPSAGRIRQVAFDMLHTDLPDPYEAWEQVIRDVRAGAGHPIARTEPKAHSLAIRAVEMIGGWEMLATSELIAADRKRFIECYRALRSYKQTEYRRLPLVQKLITHFEGAKALPK